MAQIGIHTKKLFSCKDHKLSKYICVSAVSCNSSLDHRKLCDCICKEVESTIFSCWPCEDLLKAYERKRQLESLFVLAPQYVVKPYCVGRLMDDDLTSVHDDLTSMYLEMPSKVKMLKTEKSCLITEQVSSLTFNEWLPTSNEQDLLSFFSSLFSTLGKFHQAKKYFGNIRAGIRITDKRPVFVLPAAFEKEKLDEGIRKDLGELHEMLLESKIQGVFERELFDKLCKKYTRSENGSFAYSGESLRDGSFIITHCPVVWTPTKRFEFIVKLGKYRDLNKSFYDLLTSDVVVKPILNVDFWTRVDTAEPASLASMLKPLYTRGKYTSYTNTEAIRSFHKHAYEHKPDECSSLLEMERVLYSVFPEALASLYEMAIDLLHFSSNSTVITDTRDSLPSIVKFLQE
ncbi:uncharacterized protein LOC141707446 [Apium graveolens]|uniref:uncharacterized protein LOC141707446 n=1 Tax=Apium graveolens TaxID=4045 RepID=UPI003D791519